MTFYADLGDLGEDTRISTIGSAVNAGQTVAFITDDAAKADRYLRKLREGGYVFRVIARGSGPVKDTVYVKLGPFEH